MNPLAPKRIAFFILKRFLQSYLFTAGQTIIEDISITREDAKTIGYIILKVYIIFQCSVQKRQQCASCYPHNEQGRGDFCKLSQTFKGQGPYGRPHQGVRQAQQGDKRDGCVTRGEQDARAENKTENRTYP